MVFGNGVKDDILTNMDTEAIVGLVGKHAADLLVLGVKLSLALSLITGFPMTLFPMRLDVIDMVLRGTSFGSNNNDEISSRGYYTITYGILFATLALALVLKSIYQAAGLVGATAGVFLAFMFPALIAWRSEQQPKYKVFAIFLAVSGTALTVSGVASVFKPPPPL